MYQRYIVVTKLIEIFSRGVFVLVCTYGLPLEDAGSFGLSATIIGLLAFVLGYERYIDLQRQVAGKSTFAIRNRLEDTFKFFGLHYILVLPFVMAIMVEMGWSIQLVVTVIIIIVGEHLSNFAYHSVLLDRHAFPLLAAVATKAVAQLFFVIVFLWLYPNNLDVMWVLTVWMLTSICYIVVAICFWLIWSRKILSDVGDKLPPQLPRQQYRVSCMHFIVGIVAVAALQIDRLIVGGVLTPIEIGTYFRNIALAALALQIFNIVSFNRVAPDVYKNSREGLLGHSLRVVWREYLIFSIILISATAATIVANYLLGNPAHHFGIEAEFIVLLALAVLIRAAADYAGLLLLSVGDDKKLFINQLVSLLIGSSCLWVLASRFNLLGAFFGVLVSPSLYFFMNRFSVRQKFSLLQSRIK